MRGRLFCAAVVAGLMTKLPTTLGLPAFSGAEGFGSQATGGRGGDVYHVTNLDNSGVGSLRYGVEGGVRPRTIVFDVGGTINLTSRLTINNGRLTIAGQTAPGGGILIKNSITKISGTSNVVLRHLRFRLGANSTEEGDTLWISDSQNVIIDHCSISWGRDECLSVTNDSHNITVSNCIIAEGIRSGHQYGSLVNSEHSGGGALTFHRNLYINQLGRTPRAASQNGQPMVFDFVNNVIYNWGTGGDWGTWATTTSNEYAQWNFVNNYHIAGPNTVRSNIFQPEYNKFVLNCGDGTDRIYLSGSRIDHDRDGNTMHDGVSAGWSNTRGSCEQMPTPFEIPAWAQVSTLSADDALDNIAADCGAMPWNRDSVDTRLISELQTFGGSIKTVEPGWPVIDGGATPAYRPRRHVGYVGNRQRHESRSLGRQRRPRWKRIHEPGGLPR